MTLISFIVGCYIGISIVMAVLLVTTLWEDNVSGAELITAFFVALVLGGIMFVAYIILDILDKVRKGN